MTEKTFKKLQVLLGGDPKWALNCRQLFPGLHYGYLRAGYYYLHQEKQTHYFTYPEDAVLAALKKGWLSEK